MREAELGCACRALGIEPSRLLDYDDGTLSDVNEGDGADHVLSAVRELRSQALSTWPPNDLSGHLDHVSVSRWTRRVFETTTILSGTVSDGGPTTDVFSHPDAGR